MTKLMLLALPLVAGAALAQPMRMDQLIPKGMDTNAMGNESNDDWQSNAFDPKVVCSGAAKAVQGRDGNWTFVGGGGAVETATPQEYAALRKACGLAPLRRQ